MQGTDNWLSRPGDQQETKNGIFTIVRVVSKPLRIFQFLVVLLIFVLVIFTITGGDQKVSSVICILLIVISGVYVFILAIDLISQFSGGELHAIPMILFIFLGALLFGIAVALLLPVYSAAAFWYILTTLILCFLMCIFFLIEIAMLLVFWKWKYRRCQECCGMHRVETLRADYCHPMCSETVKYDLMTSVSNLGVPSGDEEGVPDHSYRKIGYGRRRQYVDCPTSARTTSVVDIAEVQTERYTTSNIESQTQRDLKEMPVQTVSRCELCNRQMQFSSQPITQQAPCTPCPALVQLIRGVPCCPGCRCVAGIVQMPQQSQQQQTPRQDQQEQSTKEQVQWVQPIDDKSYGVLTSAKGEPSDPKMSGMSGTITKLTVASYCVTPSQKTHTSSQTDRNDVKPVKKAVKSAEPKKPRVSISIKDKEVPKKQQEDLILEKESVKVMYDLKKEPKKPIIKRPSETPAGKETDFAKRKSSDKRKSVESAQEKSSVSLPADLACVAMEKSLTRPGSNTISPSEQVAKIINRLQEIEGAKDEQQESIVLETPEGKKDVESILTEKEQIVTGTGDEIDTIKSAKKQVQIISTTDRSLTAAPTDTMSDLTLDDSKSSYGLTNFSRESSNLTGKSTENSLVDDASVFMENVEKANDTSAIKESTTIEKENNTKDESKLENLKELKDTKMERSIETSASQPQMGTQTANNRNKKTHVLRKNNKVEPIEVTHTDMDVQTAKHEAQDEAVSTSKPQSERLFTDEKPLSVEEKTVNVCSSCQRQQLPSESGPVRYYNVHRDKRGRLYCDFCATANCIQLIYKNDERLKCAGCGNFIRVKVGLDDTIVKGSRNKNDNCPKCGQMQTRVQSTPSK